MRIKDCGNNIFRIISKPGETSIPDRLLDELKEKPKIRFCKISVVYIDRFGDIVEEETFFHNMINHPRFDEFMEIEIGEILEKFIPGRCPMQSPEVVEKFKLKILKALSD